MKPGLKILALWTLPAAASSLLAYDIPGFTPDQIVPYKETVDNSSNPVTLHLHVFTPPGHQPSHQRPAIVFFFGGGWNSGSPSHFHPHCEYLASRGMVAVSAEYRIKNVHGTTPRECVKDGKSAVRYLREHAAELGIDPNRIAAGGGSSGGHVAAAAGTLTAYEEPGEDLGISSKPNALVLYNPVYDNGPGGYGYSTVQAYWEDISPLHNIDAGTPPAVVFLGTNDSLIPVATAKTFQSLMEAEGLRSDLHLYQGEPHSFFNYDVPDDGKGPYHGYQDTLFKTDAFLVSLGYLPHPREAPAPVTDWVAVFGDAGFSGGSAATASPVTTDADADSIAANFNSVTLADGAFVRLTGSVTFDTPLAGQSLHLGLFDGDDPVTAGDGTGYVGLWAEAPATADAAIASGDGTGSSHPFEAAHSSTLGPLPAAEAAAPAGTPIDFTLMIARNGDNLDISADFTDLGSYHAAQNLLAQTVAQYTFDSAAFLMADTLNATQATFSNIGLESGTVLPSAAPPTVSLGAITYLDAVEGTSGNTYPSGSTLADTSWVGPDASSTSATQWNKRLDVGGAQGGILFQGSSTTTPPPELTTQITGLADGVYTIWGFYWDQIDSATQNWVLSAGLTSGSLTTYSSPGQPSVSGATTSGVSYAGDLTFTSSVEVDGYNDGDPTLLRQMFGINLGEVVVSGGSTVNVYLGNNLTNGGNNRAWYDGVGYALLNTFNNWILGFPVGGQTAFVDDPDGDGLASGLENIFGSDPSTADATGLGIVEAGATAFSFAHPRNNNPAPAEDVATTYQWSTDLDTFFDDGTSNGEGLTVDFTAAADTPEPGTVTVTAHFAGSPRPDTLFVRLKVTQTGP